MDRYPVTRLRGPDTCTRNPLTRPQAHPDPALGLADVLSPGFPRRPRSGRLGPQSARATALPLGNISTLLTTALSLHPSLSHLPLPPAKRTRARSASSPPLSFLNASLRYPFFSLPVFHPPKSGEAPTSRAARANSPIHILVLCLRLRQSLRASLPEDHRLDCPPSPPVIRSPVSGTPSRPS